MKFIKTFLAVALLAVGLTAQAQTYGQLTPGVTIVAGASTNSTTIVSDVLDVRTEKFREFYIYIECKGTNTVDSTNVVTSVFGVSADGTNYVSARTDWTVPLTLNSTNIVSVVAKVDATGFTYFKLLSVEHPGLSTNGIASYGVKYFSRKQ